MLHCTLNIPSYTCRLTEANAEQTSIARWITAKVIPALQKYGVQHVTDRESFDAYIKPLEDLRYITYAKPDGTSVRRWPRLSPSESLEPRALSARKFVLRVATLLSAKKWVIKVDDVACDRETLLARAQQALTDEDRYVSFDPEFVSIYHMCTGDVSPLANAWFCSDCFAQGLKIVLENPDITTEDYSLKVAELIEAARSHSYLSDAEYTEQSDDSTCPHEKHTRYWSLNSTSSGIRWQDVLIHFPQESQTIPTDRVPFSAPLLGIELEIAQGGTKSANEVAAKYKVGVVPDGSVSSGCEFRLPPAQGKLLEDMVVDLTRELRRGGAQITLRCGLHVHIDCREKTAEQIYNLTYLWAVLEPTLYAMMPPSRRGIDCPSSWFCQPIGPRFYAMNVARLTTGWSAKAELPTAKLAYIMTGQPGMTLDTSWNVRSRAGDLPLNSAAWREHRYLSLNLSSLRKHKTVEVRLHSGTLLPSKILPWANLLSSIANTAFANPSQTLFEMAQSFGTRREFLLSLAPTEETKQYVVTRLEQFKSINSPQSLAKILNPTGHINAALGVVGTTLRPELAQTQED